ncbi:MAG: electron transfer flavoprotein subunit alpha/FixB family protein, partial [Firmicutes bacterium]|nr:electron transfer flavoprotein subunit alpha/FixB family protein [Bacillota bacterium]
LKGIVVPFPVKFTPEDKDVEILVTMKETAQKVKIEDAKVLVSGGRGMGSKDNVSLLYTLADTLNGEVSGTRAVIEAGWLDKDLQVGQTGKTVRPDLYLACGISGAIQHVSGMEESGLIIAINQNPNAPIFEVADLGLVGDVTKILPLVTKELRALKTNS